MQRHRTRVHHVIRSISHDCRERAAIQGQRIVAAVRASKASVEASGEASNVAGVVCIDGTGVR